MNKNHYISSIPALKAEMISQWKDCPESNDFPHTVIRYKDTDYFKRQDPDMDPETVIYEQRVKHTRHDAEHLCWGELVLYPGQVKDQYFCTQGHFHSTPAAEEYLLCTKGEGLIMYCSTEGECWCEELEEGSFYRIPPMLGSRIINISDEPLVLYFCLPGKDGFHFECINRKPFPCHVYDDDGEIAMMVDIDENDRPQSDLQEEDILRLLQS